MAQLKDSTINGSLTIDGSINLQTANQGIKGIHPESGELSDVIHMSTNGNVVVGYGGYANQNGNSHIYGDDIVHYVASAGNVNYRPYYRAGDSVTVTMHTSGYTTSSSAHIRFIVPLAKPVIGNPTISIASVAGITVRQNNQYTHGSSATAYEKPSSYSVIGNAAWNFIIVNAVMSSTTNATNNSPVGITWNGTITFS